MGESTYGIDPHLYADPYLQGNNAPVHEEIDVANLPVDGELPPDLEGIYMRNGPNPAFDPISYTCLLYTSPSPRDRQKSRMPSSA